MNTKKNTNNLRKFLSRLFVFFAAVSLYTVLNISVFFKPILRFSIPWTYPSSACVSPEGLYVLDNAGTVLTVLSSGGTLVKRIQLAQNYSEIHGIEIASDMKGNAYIYLQELYPSKQLTKSDSIIKVNIKSKNIERIYTENYGESGGVQPNGFAQYNTLRWYNGSLTFSKTEEYRNRLFVWEASNGMLTERYHIPADKEAPADIPYYTSKVLVKDLWDCYYITRRGKMFHSKEYADENKNSENINELVSEFYRLPEDEGALFEYVPQTSEDGAAGIVSNAGISGGIPYLTLNGNTTRYNNGMNFPALEIARMITAYISLIAALSLLAVYAYYYIVYIKRRYVSLYIKHIMLVISVSFLMLVLCYNVMYKPFAEKEKKQFAEDLTSFAAVSAAVFNADEIEQLADISAYGNGAYTSITKQLRDIIIRGSGGDWSASRSAGIYKIDSTGYRMPDGILPHGGTTAPAALYTVAFFNNAKGLFSFAGSISPSGLEALRSGQTVKGSRHTAAGNLLYARSPIYNKNGELTAVFEAAAGIGTLEAQVTRERLRIYEAMGITVLCAALLMMLGFSNIAINLQKLTATINEIKNGNFSARTSYFGNDELGELFHNFNFMAAALERRRNAEAARAAERSFVAMLSHEIRTPLNAILGITEVELQKEEMPQESKTNLQKIRTSGRSLLALINDLLDVSKIESGNFAILDEEYNTAALLNEAVETNKVRLQGKDIEFIVTIDPKFPAKLYGDRKRVLQVLNNILSNAIKYTRAGQVVFSVEWRKKRLRISEVFGFETASTIELNTEGEMIAVVKDTGIGIRTEDQKKIFERYGQVDLRKNRNIEGTGLGLSITRQLIDLMHGELSLVSEYGAGSTFTVLIPQLLVDDSRIGEKEAKRISNFQYTEEEEDPAGKPFDVPGFRVLVVDDIELNLEVANGFLSRYKIKPDCVLSGIEALSMVTNAAFGKSKRYDVLVVDHLMPDMDGVELMRRIRGLNSQWARTVPIYIMTGSEKSEFDSLIGDELFSGYIAKPVNIADIDAVLRGIVFKDEGGIERYSTDAAPDAVPDDAVSPGAVPDAPVDNADNNGGAGAFGLQTVPGIEEIDIEGAVKLYGGAEIYLSLIESFIDSTRPLLIVLSALCQVMESGGECDFESFRINAHGIKGAALGIFAAESGALAAKLEDAARSLNKGFILENTNQFCQKMHTLIDALNQFLTVNGFANNDGAADSVHSTVT